MYSSWTRKITPVGSIMTSSENKPELNMQSNDRCAIAGCFERPTATIAFEAAGSWEDSYCAEHADVQIEYDPRAVEVVDCGG